MSDTISVELYFGFHEGDRKTWDTEYFDIPKVLLERHLSGEDISADLAVDIWAKQTGESCLDINFIGIYSIPEEEENACKDMY